MMKLLFSLCTFMSAFTYAMDKVALFDDAKTIYVHLKNTLTKEISVVIATDHLGRWKWEKNIEILPGQEFFEQIPLQKTMKVSNGTKHICSKEHLIETGFLAVPFENREAEVIWARCSENPGLMMYMLSEHLCGELLQSKKENISGNLVLPIHIK